MAGYADRIISLLEPKVGRAMATSVVGVVCRKKGIDMADIPQSSLGALAEGLQGPLTTLAGPEFAQKMVQEIASTR